MVLICHGFETILCQNKEMADILVVEDDPILGRSVVVALEMTGYKVHWARDLASAKKLAEETRLNLILLDLGLPDGSGLELLRKVRARDTEIPIVILTAQTDEDSVVQGLESGATDYVRKPFGKRELLARLKVALKERQDNEQRIRYENLVVMVDQRRATYGDVVIELNRREFEILHYLVRNAESVVTRQSLLNHLDKDAELFDRTIDSHVSRLRSRLRDAGVLGLQISPVYGVGYRLEKR
jgi:DNA-binding response OmpR family regulator